ncbi:MAG: hypothetical protein AAF719_11625 [Pseudomonadota bacterium]
MTAQVYRRIFVALVAGLLAAACGLQGELERPEPLWGDPPIDGPDDPRFPKEGDDADEDAAE